MSPPDALSVVSGRGLEKLFPGRGEMAVRMRELDWSRTPFGPVSRWPQSLRTAVSVMLASPEPALIYWGRELLVLYNDSARFMLGTKHPGGLGVSFKVVFQESWPILGPMLERVLDTGEAVHNENLLVPLVRFGFLEDCYFTFAFIPTRDESHDVGGIFIRVTDTTAQVLGARRLALVRELSLRTALCETVAAVFRSAEAVLGQATTDLPFCLLYELRGARAQLVARTGLGPAPAAGDDLEEGRTWPLADVARSRREQLVEHLPDGFATPAGGQSAPPPTRALVLPLSDAVEEESRLVLVVGLNPRIALDDDTSSFLRLLARQLATSIESTRALEEKTRRAAQLAELDRQKTQFFSNVSHELRTPLTLMLGPLEDALTDAHAPLPGPQHQRVALVQRGAVRLLKLVNQLLEFTRLETGRTEARFQPVDLSRLTQELVGHFESAAHRAGLTLSVDSPPLGEPLWVDPEAWERIVFNLLSNAFKFTLEGGLGVRLRLEGDAGVLSVRDTGTGIPAEALPHLFQRFYRVAGAQGRSFEGSGIGLSLVQELVKLHGGSVEVWSRPGEGSEFTVRIPRGRHHLPPGRVAGEGASQPRDGFQRDSFVQEVEGWIPAVPAAGARLPAAQRGHVLIVDDNADLRAYLRNVLEPHFEVETAGDGQAALEALRARAPDVVVSDVMMPRLGGFGLLRALRSDPALRATPLILLSARAGEEASVEGLEAGADDYLVKPFSGRELLARVQTQLAMSRLRGEAALQLGRELTLKEAVQARDDFLSVASHELKTPLTGLKLQLEMLERMLPAPVRAQVAERFAGTRRQAQRLGTLVESLLDVSQVASGRLQLHRERTDVTALVADCLAQGREELQRAGCLVTFEAQAGLLAEVDPVRLEQLVRNLLSNAAKYGASRPVTVRLGEAGPQLRLEVVDHGLGVKPEDRERIFGRFERAVSARRFGGLGLGLWVARQVVEAHGGRIAVTDTPGGGATFTVLLPRLVGAAS
ncbi:ATP-binding response regulator [Corallococcus llansteffanensis]|uniref:histidine kinase n=1 Tax=Corallococcus llansteffanensis TaxID=2316731 RepID=A0A3A8PM56_9BACT|nr:ATP-binding protein [Corallococcus llansteffanensis]RKH57453.1 response regulator [Corallococcus llansteffanensis]